MVGFTYRDYLKYHKYLKEREKEEEKYTYEEKKKNEEWATSYLKILKQVYEGYKKDTVMEDGKPYLLNDLNEKEKQENIQIRKTHDELFRDILNNKEEFVLFFNSFVKIDMKITEENLEKYNRSFVTKEYKSKYSDVVYKIKNENIYLLVEHQSSIDYSMPFRMLTYCYEIMRDAIDKTRLKDKDYKLPIVVPILLYTGNRKWKVPDYIHTILSKGISYIGISMRYEIIDTNNYSKEQLLTSNSMVGFVMQAEKSKTQEEFEEAIKTMLINKPNEKEKVIRIVKYVYKDRIDEKELIKISKNIKDGEVEEVMTTIRTRLAQNERKKFREGIRQGIEQERRNITTLIAKKLLEKGNTVEEVIDITGLTKEEVEELR